MATLSSQNHRRLVKEITKLANEDSDLFRLQVDETDIYNFKAWIKGPDGTPFAGGFFEVALEFTQGWPAKAPLASFVTKVFHANVSCTGAICVSSLQKDWQTSWGITDVLNVICSLLIHPNPDSALNEEASELMHERYDDYYRIATLWTKVHASFIPPCFAKHQQSQTPSTFSDSTSAIAAPLQPSCGNANSATADAFVAPGAVVRKPSSPAKSTAAGGKKKSSAGSGAKRGLKRL